MTDTTRDWRRLALPVTICLALCLPGCNRDTPEKFIASGKAYLEQRDFSAATIQFKNAVQAAPDSGEARYLLGTALEQGDDPVSAEIELRKALSAGYSPQLVYPALVRVLLQQRQFENALLEASGKRFDNPANAELLALAGNAQLGLGKVQEARAAYSAALTADPNSEAGALGMARLAVYDRDLPRANQLVDQVLTRAPSSWDATLLKADLLLADQRFPEAARAYEKAIKLRPHSGGAYLSLVPLLVREGDLNGARAQVTALKRFAPRSAMTFYLDALVSYTQGDRTRAREAIDSVLKATPNYIPALLLAGAIAHDSGNYAQAEEYLRRVIGATPAAAYPRRLLISTYLRSGQAERAQEALDALLKVAPNDGLNLTLAGEVALANRDIAKAAEAYEKAVSLDPKNATARARLGQTHLAKGDVQRAIEDLEAASAADASRYQADIALVVLHLKRKEFDKAQVAVEGLTKKQPDNPLTYNLAGLVRLAKEDQAGARSSFERALQLQPAYFPAARNLAALDMRDGHTEAAKQRYNAILAKDPKNENALLALVGLQQASGAPASEIEKGIDRAIAANPESVRARIFKVNYLLQRGDAKGALATAQQAQAALPQNLQLLDVLGRAQLAAGEYDQAIASFGKLAALSPKSPAPLLAQAQAYAGVKDWAGARRAIQKAIGLQPDLLVAHSGLVRVEIESGHLKEAQAEARMMQKRWPTQPAGYLAEVDVLTASKEPGEVERLLRIWIAKTNSPVLVMRLYKFLDEQKRKPEADKFAGDWAEQNPKDVSVATFAGGLSTERRDYTAAARWYRSVVKAQPNDTVALNNLAWVLGQLQDPGALEYGEKALSLAPNAPAVLDTVGWLAVERGDLTRGLELLNKAHTLAPDAPSIELNLAKALVKAGQSKAARQHLEVLAKLPAGNPIRDDAEKLLSAL